MHAKVIPCDFKDSFQRGIGGSSAAAVCGLSRHRTKHDVLLALKGGPAIEQTDAMWLGKQLEDDMREFYARKTGKRVFSPGDEFLYVHPRFDWMVCHPDGFPTEDGKKHEDLLIEFKTAGLHNAKEWGDPRFCQVPQEYLCQCYHNMTVCGVQKAELVVLLGTELLIYPIEWDADTAGRIAATERDFWERHVVGNEPLPADGSEGCKSLLSWMHPKDTEPMAWAEGDAARDMNYLAEQIEILKAAEANVDELKNKVRAHIGDREGLQTDKIECTWKARKDGVRVLRSVLAKELEGVA